MPLKESRVSGFIGAVLLCIVSAVSFVFFPNRAPSQPSSFSYDLAVGLPGLFGFFFLLWAIEEFSKSLSNRTAVDSYVLAIGLGGASYGVARFIGVSSPVSPILPIGHAFSPVLPSPNAYLGFVGMLVLLLAGAGLLGRCFWSIGRTTGERSFMVVGALYVAAGLSSPFLGSTLFDVAPVPLTISFFRMKDALNSSDVRSAEPTPTRGWYDVPKIFVDIPARLWVAEEGIFRVRPAFANITFGVLAIIYLVAFAFNFTQPFDASGLQLTLPPSLVLAQELTSLGALCSFVSISRWRCPNFKAEDVLRRSRPKILWDDVSEVTFAPRGASRLSALKIVNGGRVTLTAVGQVYSGFISPIDAPRFVELAGAKLGDRLEVL